MGGRLSSLTKCICNAVAHWCEFCPEIRRKTKKNRLQLQFFYIRIRMKTKKTKKNKVFTPVCAIFIRLIEMKTIAKRFYLTILLFAILFCDNCYIVRYTLFFFV